MKLAAGIVAAVIAALILSFLLGREQDPVESVAPTQSVGAAGTTSGEAGEVPAIELEEQGGAVGEAFEPMTSRPDLLLQMQSDENSETPPRTVAGLPAIERSVELPVIDPETVSVDPLIGRTEVSGIEPEPAAPDSGFSPGPQPDIDYDGPLGGRLPEPDPNAPGPARIVGSGTVAPLAETGEAGGPGVPLDASTAEGMDPMFTVPEEGEITDPDGSSDR